MSQSAQQQNIAGQKKKPPEDGFHFKPVGGSGSHQCELRLPSIDHEAYTYSQTAKQ